MSSITFYDPSHALLQVGSSAPLKLNLPAAAPSSAAAVWTLSGQDALDDDLDLLDEDDLLDEEDKLKPDPASLRGEWPV